MLQTSLEFLKDSNLQKTFLVLGCIFFFVGITGLTWKIEKLGCFPRFVLSLFGFTMLIGSGMGYFEQKEPGSISKLMPNPTMNGPQTTIPPLQNGNKVQVGQKNNLQEGNGNISQNGNGNSNISVNGNENKINSDNVYYYVYDNKKTYFTINEKGDTEIVSEHLIEASNVDLNSVDEVPFLNKIAEWLDDDTSWSVKSEAEYEFSGSVSINKDFTFTSCPQSSTKEDCLGGTWQLKLEGSAKNKQCVLYLHHGISEQHNRRSNEVIIISFSPSYLWKSKIQGKLIGKYSDWVLMIKE